MSGETQRRVRAAERAKGEEEGVFGRFRASTGQSVQLPWEGLAWLSGTRAPDMDVDEEAPDVGELDPARKLAAQMVMGEPSQWEQSRSTDLKTPQGRRQHDVLKWLVKSDPNWEGFRETASKRFSDNAGGDDAYWTYVTQRYREKLKDVVGLDVKRLGDEAAIQTAFTLLPATRIAAGAGAVAAGRGAGRAGQVARSALGVADDATLPAFREVFKAGARDAGQVEALRAFAGVGNEAARLAAAHPRTALALGAPLAGGTASSLAGEGFAPGAKAGGAVSLGVAGLGAAQALKGAPGALGAVGRAAAKPNQWIDDAAGGLSKAASTPLQSPLYHLTGGQTGARSLPKPTEIMTREGTMRALRDGIIPPSYEALIRAHGLGKGAYPARLTSMVAGSVVGGIYAGEEGAIAGAAAGLVAPSFLNKRAIDPLSRLTGGQASSPIPVRAPALMGLAGAAAGGSGRLEPMFDFMEEPPDRTTQAILGGVGGAGAMMLGYRRLFGADGKRLTEMLYNPVSGDYKDKVAWVAGNLFPQTYYRDNPDFAKHLFPKIDPADLAREEGMLRFHREVQEALGDKINDPEFIRKLPEYVKMTTRGGAFKPELLSQGDEAFTAAQRLRLMLDRVWDEMAETDPNLTGKHLEWYFPTQVDEVAVLKQMKGVDRRFGDMQTLKSLRSSLDRLEDVPIGKVPVRSPLLKTAEHYTDARALLLYEPKRFFEMLRNDELMTSFDDVAKRLGTHGKEQLDLLEKAATYADGKAYVGSVLKILSPGHATKGKGLFGTVLERAELPEEIINPFLKERVGSGLPMVDDPLEVLDRYFYRHLTKKHFEPLVKASDEWLQVGEDIKDLQRQINKGLANGDNVDDLAGSLARLNQRVEGIPRKGLMELDEALAGKLNAQEIAGRIIRTHMGQPTYQANKFEDILYGVLHPIQARAGARHLASAQYLGGLGWNVASGVRGFWQGLLGATAMGGGRMRTAMRDVARNPEFYAKRLEDAGAWTSPMEEVFNRARALHSGGSGKRLWDEAVDSGLALHQWADKRARMWSFAGFERWAIEEYDDIVRLGHKHDIFQAFREPEARRLAQEAAELPREKFGLLMGKEGSNLTNWVYGYRGSPLITRGTLAPFTVFSTWPANYIGLMSHWLKSDKMAPRLLNLGLGAAIVDKLAYEELGLARLTGLTGAGDRHGEGIGQVLPLDPITSGLPGVSAPIPSAIGKATFGAYTPEQSTRALLRAATLPARPVLKAKDVLTGDDGEAAAAASGYGSLRRR